MTLRFGEMSVLFFLNETYIYTRKAANCMSINTLHPQYSHIFFMCRADHLLRAASVSASSHLFRVRAHHRHLACIIFTPLSMLCSVQLCIWKIKRIIFIMYAFIMKRQTAGRRFSAGDACGILFPSTHFHRLIPAIRTRLTDMRKKYFNYN